MIEAPEADCWLHPDVVVRPSPIAGRGLFARAAIPAGTVVSRLGGRLVPEAELRRLIATTDGYVDTIAVTEELHLVLPPRRDRRRDNGYGNHGCAPNLWWVGPYAGRPARDRGRRGADQRLRDQYRRPGVHDAVPLRGNGVPGNRHRRGLAAAATAGTVRRALGTGAARQDPRVPARAPQGHPLDPLRPGRAAPRLDHYLTVSL